MSLPDKFKKLARKPYRDAYVKAHLEQGIAFQIKALRESRGLTQEQLARRINAGGQSAIARLEDPSYGKASLATLEKLAHEFDVALLVKFVPFSKFLQEHEDLRPSALAVPSFGQEHEQGEKALPETGREMQDCVFYSTYSHSSHMDTLHTFKALASNIIESTTGSIQRENKCTAQSEPIEVDSMSKFFVDRIAADV